RDGPPAFPSGLDFVIAMKNFLRALRHAMPYRRRLALSIVCALCAAVLWGANFSSIYPVLKLLHTNQSPHDWVNERITEIDKSVKDYQRQVEQRTAELEAKKREQEQKGSSGIIEQQMRDITRDLSRVEAKLGPASSSLYWHRVLHKYIYRFLPPDCIRSRIARRQRRQSLAVRFTQSLLSQCHSFGCRSIRRAGHQRTDGPLHQR